MFRAAPARDPLLALQVCYEFQTDSGSQLAVNIPISISSQSLYYIGMHPIIVRVYTLLASQL